MKQYKPKIKYQLTDTGIKFLNSQRKSIMSIAFSCGFSPDLLYRAMRLEPTSEKTIKALQVKYKDFKEEVHYNEIKL